MSPLLALLLLIFALALPFFGALALRAFSDRLEARQFYIGAIAILVVTFASVLALARSNIERLQVGNLSLLLPISAPLDSSVLEPSSAPEAPPDTPETTPTACTSDACISPTALPTAASTAASTAAPTVAPTVAATEAPTTAPTSAPTEAPTTPPTEAPTPVPPTLVPPTAAPAPPRARRTYTVQSGDTLRSIAEQFNVSVAALLEANNLTAEQADSLRVGQELVIP